MASFALQTVTPGTPQFERVLALGRANSKYLGHFPRGAFEEYAAAGQIIGAIVPSQELIGYLLYRKSGMRVAVVHLCVDGRFRGHGAARALVDRLKEVTTDLHGITLRCRRDFPANDLWPRLGFRAVAERPGRGAGAMPLTLWAWDHDHPTLFSDWGEEVDATRLPAALDTNVIFDLQDPPSEKSEESLALHADWVEDAYEFCRTPEYLNDVDRAQDPRERQRRRAFGQRFRELTGSDSDFTNAIIRIRELFAGGVSDSTASDIRHIAWCVASGTALFVTRDAPLLEMRLNIFEAVGVGLVSPCELIVAHDERIRAAAYTPGRLVGSLSDVRRVSRRDIARAIDEFLSHRTGEKKSHFRQLVNRALANPQSTDAMIARDRDGNPLAFYVVVREPQRMVVPIFRVRRGTLEVALWEHIAWDLCTRADRHGCSRIEITDVTIPEAVFPQLRRIGYVSMTGGWARTLIRKVGPIVELQKSIETAITSDQAAHSAVAALAEKAQTIAAWKHPTTAAQLERHFWPLKAIDASLPTFIVPIKAEWAARLFENRLASQTLFGVDEALALSVENVYYRSSRQRLPTAPARVLWYVSDDRDYVGGKSIRAASYVTDIIVGPAKDLFQRFSRIGVYRWPEVLALAGDPGAEILAFTFTQTELLRTPVPHDHIQEVLYRCAGKGNPLAGPVQIRSECFVELYRLGRSEEVVA